MKIILRRDIEGLGQAGEVKTVKDGYARNFLLPKEKVMIATPGNLKRWELEKKKIERLRNEEISKAQEVAQALEKTSCTIQAKVGEEGKLFGSVTNTAIAHALKEAGFAVEKRDIVLTEPIKELGAYFVQVRLHPQVHTNVKVWVVQEEDYEKGSAKKD